MNNEDFEWWTKFREKGGDITHQEFRRICLLHSKYFNHKLVYPCTCATKRIQKWITGLNEIWEEA